MSGIRLDIDEARFRGAVAKLGRFRDATQRKVVRKVATQGAKIYRDQARAEVPQQNGYLKKSIASKVKTYTRPPVVWAGVGQNMKKLRKGETRRRKRETKGGISGRGDTVPIHLVENPTMRHEVRAKWAKALSYFIQGRNQAGRRSKRRDRWVYTRRIMHPGTSGSYFLRKAGLKAATRSRRVMKQSLARETLKEARRA